MHGGGIGRGGDQTTKAAPASKPKGLQMFSERMFEICNKKLSDMLGTQRAWELVQVCKEVEAEVLLDLHLLLHFYIFTVGVPKKETKIKKQQKTKRKNTVGHKSGDLESDTTHFVSVAYTPQPDPPPWTLSEQGISRGWEPIHKGQALRR